MFRPVVRRLPESVKIMLRRVRGAAINFSRLVYTPAWPKNPGGAVYLNLGCGYATHLAFVNVDALPESHIHYIRPVHHLRPFSDVTVDLVYASHCLEHFSHRRVNTVLAEWRRVLKPGCTLRLGVPDFDQRLAIYRAADDDIESILPVLMGDQNYPLNAHYCMFTRRSLTAQLLAVGFNEVREWQRGTDPLTILPDCTGLTVTVGDNAYPISLNLEAVR